MSDEKGLDPVGLDPAPEAGEPEIEIVSYGDEPEPAGTAAPGGAEAVRRLEQELAEARDRYLRLRADFDNFRKRVERDREEGSRRQLAEVLLDLLPVIDNLERAATAAGTLDDVRGGVEMIHRQFAEALRRFGLAEIPALGLPFDPRLHEAVAREESADVHAPTVVAEFQRGYWLNDRLLRPALVRVAVPPEGGHAAAADGDGATGTGG
jgi:molecular chaperone GrpE